MLNLKNVLIIISVIFMLGCTSQQNSTTMTQEQQNQVADFGVLVMAHGGSKTWNQGVINAVAPLTKSYKIEIAFGMADATSIQQAVTKLEAQGVTKIAVVRMFISGESWLARTEKILGIKAGAPAKPTSNHSAHKGHNMAFWQIDSNAQFVISQQGLSEATEMNEILLYRAQQLSENSPQESVLILAHGPADDDENQRWIANINERTSDMKAALNFNRVSVQTLREDWTGKRQAAEQRIRAFVKQANEQNRTAIVVPFRVQGFGPYAEVLEGLEYQANEIGLIPHPNVTKWLAGQIIKLQSTF